MLKLRLLTVAIILPLFLGLLFYAPNALWGAVCAVAVALAAFEWSRLCGFGRRARWLFVAMVAAACAALLAVVIFESGSALEAGLVRGLSGIAVLFWVLAVPTWLYFRWIVRNRAVLALIGLLVLVPAWLGIAILQRAPVLLFLTLGVVWIADTAAYFAGRRFGRHRLAPAISPGKTVEGLIGAYLAVLLYALAVAWLLQRDAAIADYVATMAFAAVLTALSLAGDLFESWIKRQAGAKDSGDLLPGHGGVLDRIDSLTAAMPFAALYLSGRLL